MEPPHSRYMFTIMSIVLSNNAVLDKNQKKINTNTTQVSQNTIEINDKTSTKIKAKISLMYSIARVIFFQYGK